MCKGSFSLLVAILVFIGVSHALAHSRASKIETKELDKSWQDLLSVNEHTAGRALLKLANSADATVRYMKKALSPVTLSKERAKQLIKRLTSDDEKMARAAYDELMYFDPRLALLDNELREELVGPSSSLLASILCELPVDWNWSEHWHWYSPDNEVYRFNDGEIRNRDVAIHVRNIGQQGVKSSWVRAVRAIALLESIGTPDAITILRNMATGHPDATPTKAAKAALKLINPDPRTE
jgi:hypothetical protein